MCLKASECLICIVDPINIALNKPATQSSTYSGRTASRAVDGNRNTDYYKGFCSRTWDDEPPWLIVDLQSTYSVREVVLTSVRDPDFCKLSSFSNFHCLAYSHLRFSKQAASDFLFASMDTGIFFSTI